MRSPTPHPSGARPPAVPAELVPRHVAIVMDGNGRWAQERGLPRTAGHEQGEHSLFDVVEGAIEIGVKAISAYAFSTENWKRSPDEVRFLMGFNRDVIRRRRDEMHELGVRVRWAGRRPAAVALGHQGAPGGRGAHARQRRADADHVRQLRRPRRGRRRRPLASPARSPPAGSTPRRSTRRSFARHLYVPELADADLVWRTSGEQRLSNFMLWQAAYSELVFSDVLWPDVDRRHLWQAIDTYARRDRRYGGADPHALTAHGRPPHRCWSAR